MDFIPLHINSAYTFLNSGITFDRLVNKLNLEKYNIVGLSDLNVMYGFPSFYKENLKNGIKSIFGLDIKINGDLFSLFIINENGYRNLCEISTFLEKRNGICK